MSDAYNPETTIQERLEARELEARELARKRDAAGDAAEKAVLDRQVREVERQIDTLKRKLKG